MTSQFESVCFAAYDPPGLARFWAGVLGWEPADDPDGVALRSADSGFLLRFFPTTDPKVGPNRVHFDLASTSLEDQQHTVARALALGGRPIDVGQLPEEEHVVLADPEGNELCVVEPGNSFLAGGLRIGAVSCDGSQAVGHFWSKALDWPLVWDQDEETAIQSPRGGSKISWGGGPDTPKAGRNRLHLHLRPSAASDQTAEVERLLALGAVRPDDSPSEVSGAVLLLDPDDNEFCVLTRR